jgi:hypothetical protein
MFAAHELNGREIRNCIRIAHTWATSCKEPLTTQRVLEVVNMFQEFRNDLKDAVFTKSQGQDHLFSSSALATFRQQQQRPAQVLSSTKGSDNGP